MLKHYGMYLNEDDPDDVALMTILDRYVRSRRVGAFLRAASLAYMKQDSTVAVFSARTPAVAYAPAAVAMSSAAPIAQETVVQKAKRAFFK